MTAKYAFKQSVPIMAGYIVLGMGFGVLLEAKGYGVFWTIAMSVFIYAGSMQYVAIDLITGGASMIATALMTLMVNARHLFYGISMLDKYKDTGWKKPFLIFMMCDETFALNYSATIGCDIDKGWFYFWVSLLDYTYWFTGAAMGGLLGSFIHFDTTGLSFVMTTMFLVIFLEQWLKEEKHYTALIGIAVSLLSLVTFGKDSFVIPAMAGMLAIITLFRKPIEKAGGLL